LHQYPEMIALGLGAEQQGSPLLVEAIESLARLPAPTAVPGTCHDPHLQTLREKTAGARGNQPHCFLMHLGGGSKPIALH
jgi:hypothetical protein